MTRKLFAFLGWIVLTVGCSNGAAPSENRSDISGSTAKTAATTLPADDDATVIPASAVSEEKPKSAAIRFDAALIRLTQDQQPESFATLPPDERNLMCSVLDAISAFRRTLADPNSLMSTKTAPLTALSDQFRAQAPLTIPVLQLCRSVTQFGVYDPYEPARFIASKETPVIVYCELDNFRSQPTSDSRWETRLSYEATLSTDADNSISVLSKKPTNIVDLCRNRRRDFFLADRMTIPGSLPVGKYILKITVVDQMANRVAEQTTPILVAPN